MPNVFIKVLIIQYPRNVVIEIKVSAAFCSPKRNTEVKSNEKGIGWARDLIALAYGRHFEKN